MRRNFNIGILSLSITAITIINVLLVFYEIPSNNQNVFMFTTNTLATVIGGVIGFKFGKEDNKLDKTDGQQTL